MKHPLCKTIKGKLLLIVCSLVLILGIGTVTFSYVNFYEKLENNLIHSTESNLTFLADNINQELENIYDYAKWCQQNTDIINYVKLSPSAQSYARYTTLAKERLDEEYLYNPSKSYMLRVVVANESRDDFLQYTSSYYSASQPMTDLITELPYYKDALEGRCCDLSCGLQRSPVGRAATYSFRYAGLLSESANPRQTVSSADAELPSADLWDSSRPASAGNFPLFSAVPHRQPAGGFTEQPFKPHCTGRFYQGRYH